MSDDRRRSARHGTLGDVGGDLTIVQPLRVIEISPRGAQIELAVPLQLEMLHQVRLELGGTTVIAKARVVHCRITDIEHEQVIYRAGVEFIQLAPHAEAAIVNYIERIRMAQR